MQSVLMIEKVRGERYRMKRTLRIHCDEGKRGKPRKTKIAQNQNYSRFIE